MKQVKSDKTEWRGIMIKVLGIGDNVCDKYLHTKTIYPGGNALNIAVFGKLFGAEAAYLGTFGDDEVGQHVYSVVKGLGLDLSHCRLEEGLSLIHISTNPMNVM